MNLILLGAPGSGKGTQAEFIRKRLNIPAISTGNILREAIINKTQLGHIAKPYIDEGKLVPDKVIVEMVKDRLSEKDCENGFILDGIPRTVLQAEALEKIGVKIDTVLLIDVADDEIERRISGRRVCQSCGASYHLLFNPSKSDSICDECGGKLIQRADDTREIVRDRIRVYHDKTEPLIKYYMDKGVLKTVKGQTEISDTMNRVYDTLGILNGSDVEK